LENQDQALLCTVEWRWGWPSWWEVLDADLLSVGTFQERWLHQPPFLPEPLRLCQAASRVQEPFRGLVVQDGIGRLLAFTEHAPAKHQGRLVASRGESLATLRPAAPGFCLEFGVSIAQEPFAKMALLGAVLSCW
jgi:hypothetical protein